MLKGILYALAACFIWGLIFVVPGFMTGFSPIEIAVGRYSVYGVISCAIFLKTRLHGSGKFSKNIWIRSLLYSLVTNITYYICLVFALRYSTPAICALILGLSPITIAFYGNWQQKEVSFRSLILPSCLIALGLAIINLPHLQKSEAPITFIWGLFYALAALASWSWFVVANSRFLKNNPHVNPSDWNTMLGVSTFFWALLLCVVSVLVFQDQFHLTAYTAWNRELKHFLLGCFILGTFCSWLGTFLWNKATLYLPVSLAGQLTIFETIFGVIFFYTLEKAIPPLVECLGMGLFLFAVILGIKRFSESTHPALH
jgi:drug/metabolite transporter (DMT)-like permease